MQYFFFDDEKKDMGNVLSWSKICHVISIHHRVATRITEDVGCFE